MSPKARNPICKNQKCSHANIEVSDVEARRNRCGHCFQPLDGNPVNVGVKPTARVVREGKQLRLRFGGTASYIM